jgi:hypothetical protein
METKQRETEIEGLELEAGGIGGEDEETILTQQPEGEGSTLDSPNRTPGSLPANSALKNLAEQLVDLSSADSDIAKCVLSRLMLRVLEYFCSIMEIPPEEGRSTKKKLLTQCVNQVGCSPCHRVNCLTI